MNRKQWSGEAFEIHVKQALMFAMYGLTTDGAHHKQWYLEQIMRELGMDPKDAVENVGCEWKPGIPP